MIRRSKSKKRKWPKKPVTRKGSVTYSTPSPEKQIITIKLTQEFKSAFEAMNETHNHIFLTGVAGTGKSTLLKYFRQKTKKKFVVLAPTGVAALNVKGQTIHSFFGFHPQITKERVRRAPASKIDIFQNIETIVIDEISMVRADLLDCIDRALRLNRGKPNEPFGGVQMILIGDLFQLPPVVTRDEQHIFETIYTSPYFFSADVMREIQIRIIELKKVHRQTDDHFIKLLNNVRTKEMTPEDVSAWNSLHDPYFDPEDDDCVHLTTTNKMADQRNQYELNRLDGKAVKLKATSVGQLRERRMPSEPTITIKEGAKIMFTTNDSSKRWVNGSLGTVTRLKKNGLSKDPVLMIKLDNGKTVEVSKHTWEVFEYKSGKSGDPEEEVIGSYTQYPIVLAWAVTIHKAQGKTFDKVLVDVGWGAFAHGQMYVALSRCTSFEGITLLKPFSKKDVILDTAVLNFMDNT